MFKYIDMPKLVAFYLREFSYNKNETSNLYKFIFCLCLPYISQTFRVARMNALAIAECTNSADQIARVFNRVTGGATLSFEPMDSDYMLSYDNEEPNFTYDDTYDQPEVSYSPVLNSEIIRVTLNGVPKSNAESYLDLLIPFYHETFIIWN